MTRQLNRYIVTILWMTASLVCHAQESDSIKTKKNSLTRRAYKEGLQAISLRTKDTVKNESSTEANAIYQGRIIRNIYIQTIALERSIYDTAKLTKKVVTDIADALHGSTRESVIRNHLFFEINKPLNPYELADNERFLRDLDFILDSRILATPVPGSSDSVDVTVTTRDVFSLGVSVGGSIPTSTELTVYDANLFGRGQRFSFTGLLDQDRTPLFGFSAYYRKSSILGSLASFEIGYSQLDGGRSYGDETEFAYYIRLSRPLVSPYSRLAGGIEFSNNWSENVYGEPDSVFADYDYKVRDIWLGYNIGIKRDVQNRSRQMVSARFFDGYFLKQPEQEDYLLETQFTDTEGVLGQYTFYRQNYYKTRYVLGFGRTEDVPYGYSLSFTGGYLKQLGLSRFYAGADWTASFASRKGNFLLIALQTGSYFQDQDAHDIIVNTTVSYVTRALNLDEYKLRMYVIGGYAQLFNDEVGSPIKINDSDVRGVDADSVYGDYKFRARWEAVLYTPWSLLGFRFAPFLGFDDVIMRCTTCSDKLINIVGLSVGFRTRNENLIFGTMELRLNFVPETPYTASQFSIDFKQRLRLRNSSAFVRPPGIIRY